ncbi:MAG: type III-B CRISPR-associated protein Cas10/Cmr2 [Deltaproteobacteria bacterium]|nr:type III-B CRISPR-associated protein Cas10/Cmr2 [Deltaproteobacteria bacterium]
MDLDPELLKSVSTDHLKALIIRDGDGTIDWKATSLAFWRFGPEKPSKKDLHTIWSLLPADTRVPDHTIWAHLDLTSAFAGAFMADVVETPALFAMSFGPVQEFIAQSRSTSDLWAGSHLLSRIAWEGIKFICDKLGPDTVIFPQLRGLPLVDLWLMEETALPAFLFDGLEWKERKTDANPLFCAALPNRFAAIVPADQVKDLSEEIKKHVRVWVQNEARIAVETLFKIAGFPFQETTPGFIQATTQMKGFPEIHWAAVPWSLVKGSGHSMLETKELSFAMKPFFPEKTGKEPGFLKSNAWKVLKGAIAFGDVSFYKPNPGVLYPALYDLLDRLMAAAKTIRPFNQLIQQGYRCTLCGEREWITHNSDMLHHPPGKRNQTLWSEVASLKPSWAREGEHLCGICALKRLWPSRFVESIRKSIDIDVQRYMVSTHTMALATSMARWLKNPKPLPHCLESQLQGVHENAPLPKSLSDRLRDMDNNSKMLCRRLPILMDDLREKAQNEKQGDQFQKIENRIKEVFGNKPEAYYGLILMDGDAMGAWLNGSEKKYRIAFEDAWHSQIKLKTDAWKKENPKLKDYLGEPRPPSPARHMAISGSLSGFSLELARYVVEDLYKGKLIYSGGDDVLAMIAVDDMLEAMLLLRLIYSGIFQEKEKDEAWRMILSQEKKMLDIGRGHVRYKKQLFRMMGEKATASSGAVVAHHSAPLQMVLRTLRQTEKRAKDKGGRNAFAVTILKRAGGAVELTCPWFFDPNGANKAPSLTESPMGLLIRLRTAFAGPYLSRRAAYIIQDWVSKLPSEKILTDSRQHEKLLATILAYQFKRQSKGEAAKAENGKIGVEMARLALAVKNRTGKRLPAEFIGDFLSVAEFLAREGRADIEKEERRHE